MSSDLRIEKRRSNVKTKLPNMKRIVMMYEDSPKRTIFVHRPFQPLIMSY